jgi:dipeptidyl aminopeptidase/acylaminoacyl peptidase
MRVKFLALLAALVPIVALAAEGREAVAAGKDASAFTADDLLRLKRVSDPQVSPDGRYVAFVVRETELEANRARSALWLLDLAARTPLPRQITHSSGSDTNPYWAPDGSGIYFLSSRSGSTQVWRMPLDVGEAQQVTAIPLDVGTFKVSPRGDRIALTLEVFADCASLECTTDRLAARKKDQSSGRLYNELFVRHWDRWTDGTLSMLFTAPLTAGFKAGTPIPVSGRVRAHVPSKPNGGNEEFEFSPDGSRLVFTARLADSGEAWSTNFDLYDVPADGSTAPVNLTAANPAWDTQPVFLANGDLAFLATERPGVESDRFSLFVRSASTGRTQQVMPGWDRSIRRLATSWDRRSLLATADAEGQVALFAIDPARGRVRPVVSQGQVNQFAALPGGGAVVAWSSLAAPPELFRIARGSETLRPLTDINGELLRARAMSPFERFTFAGWNQEAVSGYVVKPFGFADHRSYPIAFIIHGGPESSLQNQWNWRWNAQAFAGRGYAVVMIDFHGSTGYGQKFVDSIHEDWGGKPFTDLQKGLAAAVARYPWLDGMRACSLGGSYGGYMQNWIAGNWPERFQCIVNHAGIFDTRSMYFSSDELWFTEWENCGPYYLAPQNHERFNPAAHVAAWRTPMLVIQGALDYRVPETQGLGAFTALQRRGVASKLLYFPDEGHWIMKPANALQWYQTVFDWLDEYLKTRHDASTSAAQTVAREE